MKITIKRLVSICLIFILAILIASIPEVSLSAKRSSIEIIVKGKHLKVDTAPRILEGSTYIHVRDFAKALNFKVDWLAEEKTVKLSDSETTVLIPIGEKQISINDKKINLGQISFLKEGRTFIPLRALSEALSYKVQWDQKNNIAIVGEFTAKGFLEDTFLYTNEEYRYTMNFPNSWKKEAVIETKNGILRVYDKASYDKFKEKGFNNFGPVFEISVEESPIFITVPYEDVLLHYKDGQYIETYFGRDFQYFPDTVESYKKIYKEAKEALGTFKSLYKDYTEEKGESKTFVYDGLKLEVTNIKDVKSNKMIDDGGSSWEYKIFTCYPGASMKVLNAGMNDGKFTENGTAFASWGIELSSGERIRIVDDMEAINITEDIVGVYNLESSLYVLRFEMVN